MKYIYKLPRDSDRAVQQNVLEILDKMPEYNKKKSKYL